MGGGLFVALGAFALIWGPARADEVVADRDPRPVWLTDSSPRTLQVAGAPGSELRPEVDQTFGELDHRWVQGPYTVGRDGAVEVEVEPPASAFVHPRCETYVSDWAKDDAEWVGFYSEDADGLPLTRLLISFAVNGITTEVLDDLDYIQP